jgi:hypothetical protein
MYNYAPGGFTPWESFNKLFYEVLKLAQWLDKHDDHQLQERLDQLMRFVERHSGRKIYSFVPTLNTMPSSGRIRLL